mmetsp:Transcript_69850/g.152387  ORF Transcript_69850/g.152387 Transcript_69850/m.152387 type:complete len:1095 (+) Transcript_69850:43-3327(+)
MFNSIRSSISSNLTTGMSGRSFGSMFASGSDGDSVHDKKAKIQDGLRKADAARDAFEKDGLITLEVGENETFDIPHGFVQSVVVASYGTSAQEHCIDVKRKVEKDLLAGKQIKVTNDLMGGDPKAGVRKVLRVQYKPSSEPIKMEVDENKELHLPPHAAEGVAQASYGLGVSQKECTAELLYALFSASGRPVKITNEAMGGDPAPGKIKKLTVTYDPNRTRQAFKMETSKELATFGLIAPWLFRDLCQAIGLSLHDLYSSLTGQELLGGEKQVSGKSGEIFWFTADQRFVLKTISDAEIATLVRMLPDYSQHLREHPDSLLTRYLGVFSLEDNGCNTQFVVMNNIFEASPHLDLMYDLKGTTEDRWVDPAPGKCLKDNNFAETTVYLHDAFAAGIHKAISSDTRFLEKQGIMDYSLMLAIARDGSAFKRPLKRYSQFMGGIPATEALGVTSDTLKDVTVFIGMVDMLVTFGWKKVTANVFKSATIGITEEIDTVAPDRYASRFRAYFGLKIRGNTEKCVVSTVPADGFVTPMPALGRSGGTAAFFRASYKPGAADKEAKLSKDYWIGKDLARAKDEVAFYEVAKSLMGVPGWQVLNWMTPYRGVCRCPCEVSASGPPQDVDVMLLRNGRDGFSTCRMLDIKIGQVTAVAGWQGKSAMSAWMQTNTIDAVTNSAGQGFRLEGFDSPPDTLGTFEDLLTEQKLLKTTNIPAAKVRRFNLQRMTATQFLGYFLDLHEVPSRSGKLPEPPAKDAASHLSKLETQELVLLSCIEELSAFVDACRKVQAPQQWIGSSVMLCFDSGARPSREVLRRQPGNWGVSRVHIFDWGRSELNLPQAHARLEEEKKAERSKYWSYYRGAVAKLLFDCCSLYVSRYWHDIKSVTFTLWDKDQLSSDDFLGTVSVDVPHLGATAQGTYELSNFDGSPVKAGLLRGTIGTLNAKVAPFQQSSDSRFGAAYIATVHKAANLPAQDTLSPNDVFVEVATLPDGAGDVKAKANLPEVQGLLRNGPHLSSLKIDAPTPAWDESFELGSLRPEAKRPFLQAIGKALGIESAPETELMAKVDEFFRNTVRTAANEEKATQLRDRFIKTCFSDLSDC